jgi:hypothetical protein
MLKNLTRSNKKLNEFLYNKIQEMKTHSKDIINKFKNEKKKKNDLNE